MWKSLGDSEVCHLNILSCVGWPSKEELNCAAAIDPVESIDNQIKTLAVKCSGDSTCIKDLFFIYDASYIKHVICDPNMVQFLKDIFFTRAHPIVLTRSIELYLVVTSS